jgi:hypothetical protein
VHVENVDAMTSISTLSHICVCVCVCGVHMQSPVGCSPLEFKRYMYTYKSRICTTVHYIVSLSAFSTCALVQHQWHSLILHVVTLSFRQTYMWLTNFSGVLKLFFCDFKVLSYRLLSACSCCSLLMKPVSRCAEKRITVDWTPWRWHQ